MRCSMHSLSSTPRAPAGRRAGRTGRSLRSGVVRVCVRPGTGDGLRGLAATRRPERRCRGGRARNVRPTQGGVRAGGSPPLRAGGHRHRAAGLHLRSPRQRGQLHVLGASHGGRWGRGRPRCPRRRCRSSTYAISVRSCSAARRTGPRARFDGVGPFAATGELLAEITPEGVAARLVEIDAATLDDAGITLPMMIDDPHDAILSTRPGIAAPRPDWRPGLPRRRPTPPGPGTTPEDAHRCGWDHLERKKPRCSPPSVEPALRQAPLNRRRRSRHSRSVTAPEDRQHPSVFSGRKADPQQASTRSGRMVRSTPSLACTVLTPGTTA